MAKFKTGELKPIIDSVYKMSEVSEAHLKMEKNLNIGKIVMVNDL
jgi:tumor protein p53-inducible protein 3